MFRSTGLVKSVTNCADSCARALQRGARLLRHDPHKMTYRNARETYLMIYTNNGAPCGDGYAQCASFSRLGGMFAMPSRQSECAYVHLFQRLRRLDLSGVRPVPDIGQPFI